jgi:hypothetical protein
MRRLGIGAGLPMTRSRHRVAAAAFLVAVSGAGPRTAAAQTASQLGAWDGLMLSPVGALAPLARGPGSADRRSTELSLRYGRWQYNADDAVHNTIGLTLSHDLGFASAQVALTGAYLLVACSNCSNWRLGGIDLRSTFWNQDFAGETGRPITTGIGLRASVGGARYGGAERSTAGSAAISLPIDFAFPVSKRSEFCASIVPGFGFGRIASTDLVESGYRPMIGVALAWTFTATFGIDLGMQRVVITGGPVQLGAGFAWKLGPGSDGPR